MPETAKFNKPKAPGNVQNEHNKPSAKGRTTEYERKLKLEIDHLKKAQEKLDESILRWEDISVKNQGLLPPTVITKGCVHANKRIPVASPVPTWHTRCGWPYGSSSFSFGLDSSAVSCLKCSNFAHCM